MKSFKLLSLFIFIFSLNFTATAGDTLSLETFLVSKNIKAEKTREGIFYTVNTEGAGELPKLGDYVKLNYVGKLLDGKVFDESPKGEPFVFQLGYRQVIQGWDLAIPRLRIGTKATLYVPAEFAYGSSGIGTAIPPNAPLVFEVEVQSILTANDYDNHMRGLEDGERKNFQKKVVAQFETDKKLINDYAMANKLKVKRSESGMSYLVTKLGKGEKAKEKNAVTVSYEGIFLNGKTFDSTKDKQPFTFTIGEGKVIEGWEEGLTYFNKGSEGYIFVPSKMAYGATPLDDGKNVVPAHSTLIFKIQVIDIK